MSTDPPISDGIMPRDASPGLPHRQRIVAVDTLRLVAIFAVICMHTRPFGRTDDPSPLFRWLNVVIEAVGSFAVPFFFVAAGYFYQRSLLAGSPAGATLLRYSRRLGVVFLAWTLLYALVPADLSMLRQSGLWGTILQQNQAHLRQPVELLLRGTAAPLWFLVSLEIGLVLMAVTYPRLGWKVLFFAVPLYLLYCWRFAWALYATGSGMAFTATNGPLIGPVFVAIGFCLASGDSRPRRSVAIWVLACGLTLTCAEALLAIPYPALLPLHLGVRAVSGIAFGTGAMLLALAMPDLGNGTVLPALGRLTLGVYASHLLVMQFVGPLGRPRIGGTLWEILYPFLVFGIALGLSACLARFSLTRRIVT